MKSVRCALMIAACLVLPACNDDAGPTAPVQYPQVAGSWQGTVTFEPLVGFYADPSCPEQLVTIHLQQQGRAVSGTFQADCVTVQFEGTAYGEIISGRLTQEVDGTVYVSVLRGSLVGTPVSQIEAGAGIFVNPNGWQREGLHLRLTR